ncbi:MAG: tRNA (N6-threonylcarbamoyladenosine(37)-N6)-methyltransferase TrmO [Ruminococcus sp.]|nr:tRNA (N6-threonylcarbamoyladenosine(37)-N6)-methyltransferase TrmO [Ruminococcus sp.]
MENYSYTVAPVAVIHNDFKEKFGIPRQSGRAPSARAKIVFLPKYRSAEALRGIEGFSHLWLLFDFSMAHREEWSPTVRPPRLGGNTRVGVFASRSPFRPNHIGLSCVKLEEVCHSTGEGTYLIVSGADLLDGTPILDIKPYLPASDCVPEAAGGYADGFVSHRLEVVFPEELLALIPEDKRAALTECLADDPRPSYQHDPERLYSMRYGDHDIRFRIDGEKLVVSEAAECPAEDGE